MSMLYRTHPNQPVLSLTKVNSVWDDAGQHAGFTISTCLPEGRAR